jgi:hypothetical protein
MTSNRLSLACGVAALFCCGAAHASVIYSGVRNINVPNTGPGVYVNVVNGNTSTRDPFPILGDPGENWDINVYGSGLRTFGVPNNAGQTAPTPIPAATKGYVSSSPTSLFANVSKLAAGTTIGPASVWNINDPFADDVSNVGNALVGFRFRDETTGNSTHYGWMRVNLVDDGLGTIIDYAYESTPNAAIAAGATPEPATMAVLTAAGLVSRRRRN